MDEEVKDDGGPFPHKPTSKAVATIGEESGSNSDLEQSIAAGACSISQQVMHQPSMESDAVKVKDDAIPQLANVEMTDVINANMDLKAVEEESVVIEGAEVGLNNADAPREENAPQLVAITY